MHVSASRFRLQCDVNGHSSSVVHESGGSVFTQVPSSHIPETERQQVTKPAGLPHVDRAAQRLMLVLASLSRQFARRNALAACATQLTYRP
jgi:hypothetical protein